MSCRSVFDLFQIPNAIPCSFYYMDPENCQFLLSQKKYNYAALPLLSISWKPSTNFMASTWQVGQQCYKWRFRGFLEYSFTEGHGRKPDYLNSGCQNPVGDRVVEIRNKTNTFRLGIWIPLLKFGRKKILFSANGGKNRFIPLCYYTSPAVK